MVWAHRKSKKTPAAKATGVFFNSFHGVSSPRGTGFAWCRCRAAAYASCLLAFLALKTRVARSVITIITAV